MSEQRKPLVRGRGLTVGNIDKRGDSPFSKIEARAVKIRNMCRKIKLTKKRELYGSREGSQNHSEARQNESEGFRTPSEGKGTPVKTEAKE